jgi:hypothetical protein
MSGAVRIDMRRHLLCQPSLPDFRQLHPELRPLLDAAMREDAPALCNALAGLANTRPAARDALALASLLREFKCEAVVDDDRPLESVVLEFGVADGIDALAVCSDGLIGWYDAAQAKLREGQATPANMPLVAKLFEAVQAAASRFGPARPILPPGPAAAEITITRITRDGAAFGKGPMQAIATDKYGGPIIHWGLQVADLIRA